MRKVFALVLFTLMAHTYSAAQADTIRLSEMSKGPKIVTDRPPQALYFQLGGSGPILSANYDRRFSKTLNGAGFAVGLGYWRDFGISMVSIPVSLNYLIGRKTHFVELAGGTTFLTASTLDWYDEDGTTESAFIHHVNLGYRHQPAAGGFFFRGGFSPLFGAGESFMSFYLGFGYNF
jgi:hypothetical protein